MSTLVRAYDWSKTPLGPLNQWPQSLKTAVRILLSSRYAMWIGWGAELTFLYNETYGRITLAKKHPWALGRPASEVWSEIWDDIAPRIRRVLATGEATWDEALLLFLERNGYPEETYHTFSYSPLSNDEGQVVGVFCVVTEETERIIWERRLRSLRSLATDLSAAISTDDICSAAGKSLAQDRHDLPFALAYLLDAKGESARRSWMVGFAEGHPAIPEVISLKSGEAVWPIHQVLATGASVLVGDLEHRFPPLPHGPWKKAPEQAVLAPISQQGSGKPAGVLIVGLNPYRLFDAEYRGYIELIAGQIAASLANANAYEAERKRSESLAEIDRAKMVFFSNISHEFRTPLTLIMGPLEQAATTAGVPPEVRRQLRLAHRSSVRLEKLVNNLLDFSRIEAGKAHVVRELLDLPRLTREIVSGFQSLFEKAGLSLSVAIREPFAEVYADRDSWEKIVLNLLSNAFKFTLSGGVAVELEQSGGFVCLTVADTGVGIPAAELPKIFERFERVEGARGRSFEGSGIGLALVQELVKLHGGFVDVESEEGVGTRFRVRIPAILSAQAAVQQAQRRNRNRESMTATRIDAFVSEAQQWIPGFESQNGEGSGAGAALPVLEPAAPGPARQNQAGARQRVLLADDSPDMRRYISGLLESKVEVEEVSDGLEALESIERRRPDLVLSDVMMPRMDGLRLLQAIRAKPDLASLAVILLTARAGEEPEIEGLHAGADDYLVKPFSARELIARVESMLKIVEVRAASEQALRAERARLLDLFRQAPVFMTVLRGPRHVFELVNPLYQELIGPRDVLGKPVLEALPEVINQGFIDILDRVYQTGEPFIAKSMPVDVERIAGKPRERRYLDFIYQPMPEADGKISGVLVVGADVTESRQAEEGLRKSERLFKAVFNRQFQFMLILSPDCVVKDANAVCFSDTDVAREAVIGQVYWETPWWSRMPDRQREWKSIFARLLAGEQRVAGEGRFQTGSGEVRNASYSVAALRGDTGEILSIIVEGSDITDRKKNEDALRKSQEELSKRAQLLDLAHEPIIVRALDDRILFWNKGAERVYGYTAAEACGRCLRELLQTVFPTSLQLALGELHRTGHWEGELLRKTRSGATVTVASRWVMQKNGEGRPIAVLETNFDITERKLSEAALRMSEKLASVGRMAATLAHEVNNPLESVTNLVYLSQREPGVPESVRKYLATADEELARIGHMTRQTLGLYRESASPQPVLVSKLLNGLLAMYSPRIQSRHIKTALEVKSEVEVRGVPGELRQVFSNLLSNSIQAVGLGGAVRLRVTSACSPCIPSLRGVRVTIADNGSGIPRENLKRIFEPFFTTKQNVGTGLGLWISKEIVKQNFGTIQLRSSIRPDRSWTVASVFLPSAPVSSEKQPKQNQH